MKRLFCVVDQTTGQKLNGGDSGGQYFSSKAEAKAVRNAANANTESGARFRVSPGPDHWRG